MQLDEQYAMGAPQEPAISADIFAELVDMIGADMPDVVVDLLDTYLEESASLVKLLQSAEANNKVAEMVRPAHSLKSSSASVGALQLSAQCAALESYLRDGRGQLDVKAQVAQIQQELARVHLELNGQKEKLRGA